MKYEYDKHPVSQKRKDMIIQLVNSEIDRVQSKAEYYVMGVLLVVTLVMLAMYVIG